MTHPQPAGPLALKYLARHESLTPQDREIVTGCHGFAHYLEAAERDLRRSFRLSLRDLRSLKLLGMEFDVGTAVDDDGYGYEASDSKNFFWTDGEIVLGHSEEGGNRRPPYRYTSFLHSSGDNQWHSLIEVGHVALARVLRAHPEWVMMGEVEIDRWTTNRAAASGNLRQVSGRLPLTTYWVPGANIERVADQSMALAMGR